VRECRVSLTYPPKNKPIGVRSGDLGGHNVGPHLPVHLLANGSSEIVSLCDENGVVLHLVERRMINSTSAFEVLVSQFTFKCYPVFGMKIIIILTCVKSRMGLILKPDKLKSKL
jgi:hypothetical protein